jgi:hypothetical protein
VILRDHFRRGTVQRWTSLVIAVICISLTGVQLGRPLRSNRTAVAPVPTADTSRGDTSATPVADYATMSSPPASPPTPTRHELRPVASRDDESPIRNDMRVPTRSSPLAVSTPPVAEPIAPSDAITSVGTKGDVTADMPSLPGSTPSPSTLATPLSVAAATPEERAAPAVGVTAAASEMGISDEQRIAAVLKRFTEAYARLDAAAAKAVWPTVDGRALSRAFDALETQSIVFEDCKVRFADSEARAACDGELTYVPKVGRRSERTVAQRWNFVIKKHSDEWTIADAQMR